MMLHIKKMAVEVKAKSSFHLKEELKKSILKSPWTLYQNIDLIILSNLVMSFDCFRSADAYLQIQPYEKPKKRVVINTQAVGCFNCRLHNGIKKSHRNLQQDLLKMVKD